jgi:hypothetical protein
MPNQYSFKRSQLRDPEFFQKHEKQILLAQARGEIVDDMKPKPGGAARTGRRWITGAVDPTQEPEAAPRPPAQRAGADLSGITESSTRLDPLGFRNGR